MCTSTWSKQMKLVRLLVRIRFCVYDPLWYKRESKAQTSHPPSGSLAPINQTQKANYFIASSSLSLPSLSLLLPFFSVLYSTNFIKLSTWIIINVLITFVISRQRDTINFIPFAPSSVPCDRRLLTALNITSNFSFIMQIERETVKKREEETEICDGQSKISALETIMTVKHTALVHTPSWNIQSPKGINWLVSRIFTLSLNHSTALLMRLLLLGLVPFASRRHDSCYPGLLAQHLSVLPRTGLM